jgi:hypothetical protein
MADIFISYARADRARAERLAHVLREHEWSVWWDRYIPPGKTFDEVIEEALAQAKSVIVLWSHDSVRSEWVKAEASDAARRRILVPILADDVKIPLEFRRIQTARLIDWANLPANRDWDQLSQALTALLGGEVETRTAAVPATPTRRLSAVGAAAAAIVVFVALALAGYLSWHGQTATRVDPDNTAHRVSPPREVAKPAASSPAPIPNVANEPAPVVQPKPSEVPGRRVSPARAESSAGARAATPPDEVIANRPLDSVRGKPTEKPVAPSAVEAGGGAVIPTALPTSTTVKSHTPLLAKGGETTFSVTHMRGVFRREVGRLSISADGVRYEEAGSASNTRVSFELSCGELRKVDLPNVIVDGEQRTLELRVRDRSYRLGTANTATRDGIVAALSRTCGTR